MSEPQNFTSSKLDLLAIAAADKRLPAGSFRVLYAIASFVSAETAEAFPSQERIGARAGMSRRGVQDALAPLYDAGYIDVEIGGKGRANTYRLRREPARQDVQVQKPTCTSERARPARQDVQQVHVRTCTNTLLNTFKEHPQGETPPTPSSGDRTKDRSDASEGSSFSEFEEWWRGYPRKDGKGTARRAYASARRKASAEELTAGRDRYAALRRHEDPKFTRHASTWLNGEGWLDEPPQPHVLAPDDPAGGDARPVGGFTPRPAHGSRPAPFSATHHLLARYAASKQVDRTARDLDDAFGTTLDLEAGR